MCLFPWLTCRHARLLSLSINDICPTILKPLIDRRISSKVPPLSVRPALSTAALSLSPRTIRELAYRVLERHRVSGRWVQEELADEFARGTWSAADRRLATELVCGVVRRQRALTVLLQPAIARPWERIEPELVTLLWLGAYQLVYLDRVPAFAAIHETVEVARTIGQQRWTGFLNGVLRTIGRVMSEQTQPTPGAAAVPVRTGVYRQLGHPVFPDPETDLAAYVAQAFSLPDWLVQRWAARLDRDQLLELATAVNTSPGVFVRVNRRKTTPEALQAMWQETGITSETTDHPDALRLHDSGAIEQLPGYREGLFSPQDLTAMRAAVLLGPGPEDRVWDVCAAPGTKACHLAEMRDDHGSILATDIHPERVALIADGAARLGLTSLQVSLISPELTDLPAGPFDAILVDAPCSNTGVLQRRPEARWRLQPGDVSDLRGIQIRLLTAAVERLRPGGRLVYSTCSIEPEENGQVVADVMSRQGTLDLLSEQAFWPGPLGDGGYQALLTRREA